MVQTYLRNDKCGSIVGNHPVADADDVGDRLPGNGHEVLIFVEQRQACMISHNRQNPRLVIINIRPLIIAIHNARNRSCHIEIRVVCKPTPEITVREHTIKHSLFGYGKNNAPFVPADLLEGLDDGLFAKHDEV